LLKTGFDSLECNRFRFLPEGKLMALAERMDAISRKLTGFNIGRYDIRYSNQEDLRAGRNFQIIELNGAASEATSIYDSRNSLLAAYRTLFRQWDWFLPLARRIANADAPRRSLRLSGMNGAHIPGWSRHIRQRTDLN